MVNRYNRITLKNAAALTTNINYPIENETAFQNPQTSQNGLAPARSEGVNSVFRTAIIQLLSTSTATTLEVVINKNLDDMVIITKGGSRTIEYADKVFISSIDIIARGGAAIGDIIIELRR